MRWHIKSRRRVFARLGAVACALVLLSLILIRGASAQTAVDLGTAGNFAVLAGSTITNSGPTIINGDIGLHPGTAITGFPPGIVNGAQHTPTSGVPPGGVALQAKADLVTAYNDAAGRTPATPIATELGGQTLTSGVYSSGTFGITGTLTLDAQNNPNAVWIFQSAATLTTADNSVVMLINGAQPCNVFWQVTSSATLGVGSTFVGTILALTTISQDTVPAGSLGAVVNGRLLARNGAVNLDTNLITPPVCATTSTTGATTSTTAPGATTSTTAPGATTTSTAPGATTTSTAPGATTTSTAPTTSTTTSTTSTTAPTTTTTTTAPLGTTIAVIKDALPLSRPEPGGTFTFRVGVLNSGLRNVSITSLVDDVYGNLNGRGTCSTGALLIPGQIYVCEFDGNFTGVSGASQTDIVTATVVNSDGAVVTAQDSATVFITAPGTPVVIPPAGQAPLFTVAPGTGVFPLDQGTRVFLLGPQTGPFSFGQGTGAQAAPIVVNNNNSSSSSSSAAASAAPAAPAPAPRAPTLARTGVDSLALAALGLALLLLGCVLMASTPALEGGKSAAGRKRRPRRR